MFDPVRANYQSVTGTPLTISDSDIEGIIMSTDGLNEAFMNLTDEEKPAFIEKNLPAITQAIVAEQGLTADPTATVATTGKGDKPAAVEPVAYNRLTDNKKALVTQLMSTDRELKRARSAKATIDGVLISRPAPVEWMQGVPACPTDIEKARKSISSVWEGSILDWLKTTTPGEKGQYVVPTSAQLAELAKEHQRRFEADQDNAGKTYKAPAWVTNTQDADVQAIRQALDAGQAFQVMVAGPDANEAAHVNAWKWATKGYIVTYPETLEGAGAMTTKNFSVNGLKNFLFTEADGAIVAPKDDKTRMTAMLALVRKKGADRTVQEPQTVVRVRNNNAKCVTKDMLKPIMATTGATKKMSVKSLLSYLVVQPVHDTTATGASSVHFRVARRRLSLTWENAPEFRLLPEFENLPGLTVGAASSNQGKLSSKQRGSVNDAMMNMYAQLVANTLTSEDLAKQGLESISAQVLAQAQQAAAKDAEAFA